MTSIPGIILLDCIALLSSWVLALFIGHAATLLIYILYFHMYSCFGKYVLLRVGPFSMSE